MGNLGHTLHGVCPLSSVKGRRQVADMEKGRDGHTQPVIPPVGESFSWQLPDRIRVGDLVSLPLSTEWFQVDQVRHRDYPGPQHTVLRMFGDSEWQWVDADTKVRLIRADKRRM